MIRFIVSVEIMKVFNASGSFKTGKSWQVFKIEIAAEDPDAAMEKLVSTIGSKHRVRRDDIKVEELKEIPVGEATNSIVQYMVGEQL